MATETLPGPDLGSWRNRLAHRIANFALNRIASAEYRNIIDGAIVLGMRTAARDVAGLERLDALEEVAVAAIHATYQPRSEEERFWIQKGIEVRLAVAEESLSPVHFKQSLVVPHHDPSDVDGGGPFGI